MELINWDSMSDIDRHYNKTMHQAISKCCKGILSKAYNYIWKYNETVRFAK